MKSNSDVVKSLAESPVFRDYERAFVEAMGLPLSLVPAEDVSRTQREVGSINRFCALVGSAPGARAACLECSGRICQRASDGAAVMMCPYGLSEAAVPVRIGREVVGYLRTGQVAGRSPTPAQCDRAVAAAQAGGVTGSESELRSAYAATPVMPVRKLQSVTQILSSFSSHLTLIANQIVLQESQAESPIIGRARQYIAEHLSETITLAQVAKAMHTSTFYFCKLFRRFTGMTFTEFVSRQRIERAKELLLNPHRRVTEVAYEVGFQSLTHFNRRFRKFVGEPPTVWRIHATAQ